MSTRVQDSGCPWSTGSSPRTVEAFAWRARSVVEPECGCAFRSVRRPRLHEGVVPIAGVATKHYLRDEIAALLEARGLRPLEFAKIEYPWTSEFAAPPRWMQAPYPWDWLCVARKAPARTKPKSNIRPK